MGHYCYFEEIFSNFLAAVTMRVTDYFTRNMRMVYFEPYFLSTHYTFLIKFFDNGISFTLSALQKPTIAEYKNASNFSENKVFFGRKSSFWNLNMANVFSKFPDSRITFV